MKVREVAGRIFDGLTCFRVRDAAPGLSGPKPRFLSRNQPPFGVARARGDRDVERVSNPIVSADSAFPAEKGS
jgi:hypothetical protein